MFTNALFRIFLTVVLLSLSVFSATRYGKYPADVDQNIVDIDEGVVYGEIRPFQDEWLALQTKMPGHVTKSPAATIGFWFRCVNYQVRAYWFIEDITPLKHGKEAVMMPGTGEILNSGAFKMFADGVRLVLHSSNAGGEFFFNISKEVPKNHVVDITIDGLKHYTRFPVSACIEDPSAFIISDSKLCGLSRVNE